MVAPRAADSAAERWWFRFFQIGLAGKLLAGLVELVGAIMLVLTPRVELVSTVQEITRFLPLTHSGETLTRLITDGVTQLAAAQTFAVLYLLTHGLAKVVLVVLVWRGRLWAYPALIVVFGVFTAYQIYRIVVAPSVGMVLLTVFDIALLWLTRHEWRRARARAAEQPASTDESRALPT